MVNKNIDCIFHLADIHIRLLKRHNEYKSAFGKVYNKAKQLKKEFNNPIVIIAGDIVHAKNDISPELIDMVYTFIDRLSKIVPVYVFPGNHDANMNNPDRLDALSPILKPLLNSDRVFYSVNSTNIELENINLIHFSLFDDVSKYSKLNRSSDKLNIGVFHGPIHGSSTDTGQVLTNNNYKLTIFDGLDGVLLGDIHKRQCMQRRSDGKPEIWYPASLIQQNHGETLENHGGLVWKIDGDDIKVEEWNINHDYGYITINVENGILPNNITLPKKPRIRLSVKNTTTSELNEIKAFLKKQYKVEDIQIQKDKSNISTYNSSEEYVIGNMHDVAYQNQLIKNYVSNNFENIIDNDLDELYEINNITNNQANVNETSKHINWKPIKFEFNNTFSYGENNIINFEDMRGVFGLFAPNASGKSGLLDSILFSLFDKTSRTNVVTKILNVNKKNLYTKFTFSINDKMYVIERKGKYQKYTNSVKVLVDFYTYDENGKVISLNGENRNDTNNIIQTYIGTYDDFIMTTFNLQNSNSNFLEMKQTERKQILSQILDINIFNQLYEIAKSELRTLEVKIKSLDEVNLIERLSNIEEELITSKDQIKTFERELEIDKIKSSELQLNISNLEGELNALQFDQKLIVKESVVEEITNTNKLLQSKIEKVESNLSKIEQEILDNEKTSDEIKNKFTDKKIKQIEFLKLKYDKILLDLDKNENLIKSHKKHLQNSQQLKQHLSHKEFDPNCNMCVKNNKTELSKINELNLEITKLNNLIDKHTLISQEHSKFLNDNSNVISEYEEMQQFTLKTKTIENENYNKLKQINSLKDELTSLKNKLEFNLNYIKIYYENKNNINKALEIKSNLQKLREQYEPLKRQIEKSNKLYYELGLKIGELETKYKIEQNNLELLHQLKHSYRIYDIYMKTVSKNGLPTFIINSAIPIIEQEVNRILSQLVDFSVLIDTSDNNIEMIIAYDENNYWPLELCSGMEKFISAISVKIALHNIMNLPKPNFIAIDEGWGSLSSDNLNNIFMLFDYLKTEFDFVIIISHLESMRDLVDGLIEVNKINGFSSIKIV